jgi:hypothetical protein
LEPGVFCRCSLDVGKEGRCEAGGEAGGAHACPCVRMGAGPLTRAHTPTSHTPPISTEEAADNDYEEEKVSDDVPDSDFNESEEDDDGKGSGTDEDEGNKR